MPDIISLNAYQQILSTSIILKLEKNRLSFFAGSDVVTYGIGQLYPIGKALAHTQARIPTFF